MGMLTIVEPHPQCGTNLNWSKQYAQWLCDLSNQQRYLVLLWLYFYQFGYWLLIIIIWLGIGYNLDDIRALYTKYINGASSVLREGGTEARAMDILRRHETNPSYQETRWRCMAHLAQGSRYQTFSFLFWDVVTLTLGNQIHRSIIIEIINNPW